MKISKKKKVEREPQYYNTLTNIKALNYKVYYMGYVEKAITFLAVFAIGAGCGYLFFGGLCKNEFNEATKATYVLNIMIPGVIGTIAGYIFLPIRVEQIIAKRQNMIKKQFLDMLEGLSTSLNAGKNVTDAFLAVQGDLLSQYEQEAFINNEMRIIISGIRNNQELEELLSDFGKRSGVKDIAMFASIFRISYRKGGDIKDVIKNTNDIMRDKIMIQEEIETTMTSGKNELNTMMAMPVIMVALFKSMGDEMGGNFATTAGVIAIIVALIIFALALFVGRKIMEIKV